MTDYIRIPIRDEEHKELLRLQNELTGKIDSYLSRPSLSDVIRYLLEKEQEKNMEHEWTYRIETADRYQMANDFLEGAGYRDDDHEGMSIEEKAQAVADYYAEAHERGDIAELPHWDDGDPVDIYDILVDFGFEEEEAA